VPKRPDTTQADEVTIKLDDSFSAVDKTIPLKRDYLEHQNMVPLRPYFTAENQSSRCRYPVASLLSHLADENSPIS